MIIITLAILLFFSCKLNVALLKNSEDVNKSYSELVQVKSIRRAVKSDSLIVTETNGLKKTVACDSIWGIKFKGGTIYRNFDDQYYLLRENSDLIIYSQSHSGYKTSYTSYYFSKGLDAKIHPLKQKSIKREFESDTCFLNKLENEIKWYQDYSTYDRKHKTYLIVKLFKTCKK